MRYVIIGAGGIGGAMGGRLGDAGHEVVLVARGVNARALRDHGLRLATPERIIQVQLPVVESVAELELRTDDVLVLCVKSQDTAKLLAEIAVLPVGDAMAGEALPLICAQNGTSNEAEAIRMFRNVHGIGLMLQATHLEPGKVSATGSPVTGVLELGRYPSGSDDLDRAIAADLRSSAFVVDVRDDVMAWKRAKLVRNLRNALEAMCGPDLTGDAAAAYEQIRKQAMAEARECFARAGMSIVSPAEWDARQDPATMSQKPVEGVSRSGGSTWQSVTRGLGAVETDYLNGDIVKLGREIGVPTPMNERIQRTMWAFLRRAASAGSLDPQEILAG